MYNGSHLTDMAHDVFISHSTRNKSVADAALYALYEHNFADTVSMAVLSRVV